MHYVRFGRRLCLGRFGEEAEGGEQVLEGVGGGLAEVLKRLDEAAPKEKTSIGQTLVELGSQIRGRSVILLFSDLFDDIEEFDKGLRALGARGHDVVVFHVLDRDEVEFPFERMTRFEGLEAMPELLADPRGLRDAYLQEVEKFQEQVRKSCRKNRAEYVRLVDHEPLDVALSSFLAARIAQSKRARR